MEKEKRDKRKYIIFTLIIIIAVVISGIRLYWEEELSGLFAHDCTAEYGHGECINGVLLVPFYNPNTRDITYIRITVPYGIETNVTLPADFTVNSPLKPEETGVLRLVPCKNDIDVRAFSIKWCCGGDCYRGSMSRPSSEVFLEVIE